MAAFCNDTILDSDSGEEEEVSNDCSTDEFQKTVELFQFVVEGVGILTVGSIGLIINSIALYILFRKQVSCGD